jgi:hypothetical protein
MTGMCEKDDFLFMKLLDELLLAIIAAKDIIAALSAAHDMIKSPFIFNVQ